MCSGAFGAWGKVCLAYAREKLYNGKMDERYSALNINSITFYPLLHSDKLIKSIGPKKKEKGAHRTLIYPDGTTIPITEAFPDIDVLKKFIK